MPNSLFTNKTLLITGGTGVVRERRSQQIFEDGYRRDSYFFERREKAG